MVKNRTSNYLKSIYNLKVVKWILIPFLLILLWIATSLFINSYKSFTVLEIAHYKNKNDNFKVDQISRGQSIEGVFRASENNLGIISVRFGEVPKTDLEIEDELLFQLKEVGSSKIIYQNKYKSGTLKSYEFFPFGFGQIKNSKGKTYDFKITSLKGNDYNVISISKENPIYITKYKFSKDEVFKTPKSILLYFIKKFTAFVTNSDKVFSSLIFLLPFIFYASRLVFQKEYKINLKTFLSGQNITQALVAVLIVSYIVLFKFINTGFMLGLVGIWVYTIIMTKSKSLVTFCFSFAIIVLAIFSIYLKLNISVDNASAIAYFLLLFGFIQSITEYMRKTK